MSKLTFNDWIASLDVDVIQGEFGYEPGEFSVYPSHWRGLYNEGLTPAQAWRRALDAHKARRDEAERAKLANYERIKAEDAALIRRSGESPVQSHEEKQG